MHSSRWITAGGTLLLACLACVGRDVEQVRAADLTGAMQAFDNNIAAIQRKDTEAYLQQYLDAPDLAVVDADSVRRGYLLFAEARRASNQWPDTLIAGRPQLVWISPGVVWGAYRFQAAQNGAVSCGVSERLFVKAGGGWKIKVTGVMERPC